jgi:hypothetical protein
MSESVATLMGRFMAARLSFNLYTLLAVSMKRGPKSLQASNCLIWSSTMRYPGAQSLHDGFLKRTKVEFAHSTP